MADEGDRLVGGIEGLYQGRYGPGAPQLVGGIAARDDEGIEIVRRDPLDGGVDRHRPVALLARHGLVIEAGHSHRHVLLAEAVERVQQFHVLELISGEEEHFPSCESHGIDPMPGSTRRLNPGSTPAQPRLNPPAQPAGSTRRLSPRDGERADADRAAQRGAQRETEVCAVYCSPPTSLRANSPTPPLEPPTALKH